MVFFTGGWEEICFFNKHQAKRDLLEKSFCVMRRVSIAHCSRKIHEMNIKRSQTAKVWSSLCICIVKCWRQVCVWNSSVEIISLLSPLKVLQKNLSALLEDVSNLPDVRVVLTVQYYIFPAIFGNVEYICSKRFALIAEAMLLRRITTACRAPQMWRVNPTRSGKAVSTEPFKQVSHKKPLLVVHSFSRENKKFTLTEQHGRKK